jgi:hypothetical protein
MGTPRGLVRSPGAGMAGFVAMEHDRERHLRELAERLLFNLQKDGTRFTLTRDIDVPARVRHENLTADEVEDVLNTWKLRGPHGG